VNAAAPLIEYILTSPRAPKLVLSTSTTAGQKRAQSLPLHPDLAVLAPCDFLPCLGAFLRRVRPFALLIIETELWPATLRAVAKTRAKIVLANGRITPRAMSRYRWILPMMRPLLAAVSRAAVQTQEDAARFAELGVPPVVILPLGNMKNDLALPSESERSRAAGVLRGMGWSASPIWAAGSTWPDEEEAVIAAYLAARAKAPGLKLILAPRHVERCGETQRSLARAGIAFDTYSARAEGAAETTDADCLLVDRLGALRGLYTASDLVFVGGTLNSVGGHNLLEPAMAGKPVLYGPSTTNTVETARALEYGGGGFRVRDGAELGRTVERLISDRIAREAAGRKAAETARLLSGATRKTFEFLSPVLFPELPGDA
jgi:3-deoxy-D-manno-octulosonic-acid transferase